MRTETMPTIVVETTLEDLVAFMRTLPSEKPETKGKMKPDPQTTGTPEELYAMAAITHERERQQPVAVGDPTHEQWDHQHDDGHMKGELWRAALFYANTATKPNIWPFTRFHVEWPWSPEWFKPWKKDAAGNYTTEIDKERCLVKAGALIIAEQERLERALQKVVSKLAEIQTPENQ